MEEKKERTKKRRKKEQKRRRRRKRTKKSGIFFEISFERKTNNPPQCLVWFRLNGLGSSQNGQNGLIHNLCIGGCSFT
jgi:hypothetical protein